MSVEFPSLIDHHCHGLAGTDLDRPAFEAFLGEGGPPPPGFSNFDTPLGLAVRRHCAPLLDLEPHATPDTYLGRRRTLGVHEVTGRLLRRADIGTYVVDTGLPTDLMPSEATDSTVREVVRLERVAELLATDGAEPDAFADSYARRLAEATHGAVGVKSIAAYRVGFDFDPSLPGHDEVTAAAARWLEYTGTGTPRLADPTLTRMILWSAVELGLPIQFHVGYGDRDIRLHHCDPALLTDFFQRVPARIPLLLLHCYPYHRQAGYLAAVHPHVYFDLGLTLPHVDATRATAILAEAMELAPFSKMLFSSDAYGLPELFYLGALAFRRGLGRLLDERVGAREWSAADAARIASAIAADNATRVYDL